MKTDSTLGGPKVKSRFRNTESADFGIAKEHLGLVMKYLTEIYDDPVKAAVRESICNALDAMIAIGSTTPVHITAPGVRNRYFEVTDTGIGMTKETVLEVYTQYGESSKRDSDDAIGGFGLGCKSPLAIEDEFFLDTTKDGWTTVAKNYKNTNGMFKCDIIDHYESDKPNGTTVRINLKRSSSSNVDAAVRDFLTYVPKHKYTLSKADTNETVDLDYVIGNPEKWTLISEQEDGVKVYVKNKVSGYHFNPLIIMGDVAYHFTFPAQYRAKTLTHLAKHVAIVAPINSVDITTSRENVQETKRTHTFLTKTLMKYEDDLKSHFQTLIDTANDPQEIYTAVTRAKQLCNATYLYKGKPVVYNWGLNHAAERVTKKYGSSAKRSTAQTLILDTGKWHTFLVTPDDTPATKEGAVTRAYNSFMSHKGVNDGYFYFLDKDEPKIKSWWIENNSRVSYTTKAEILEGAAEYRREQRKNTPATQRVAQKVKYIVVNNDPSVSRTPNDWMQMVEYTDIDKGIKYLTVDDLLDFGIANNRQDRIHDMETSLKRLFDVFKIDYKVLLLDNGKKEDTMVKRTRAEKLVLDPEFLVKEYEESFRKEYQRRVAGTPCHELLELKRATGTYFETLADPRFAQFQKSSNQQEFMSERLYDRLTTTFEDAYAYRFGVDNHKRDKWATTWRRWRKIDPNNDIRSSSSRLMMSYNELIPITPRHVRGDVLVTVYNALYRSYMS